MTFEIIIQRNTKKNTIEENISNPIINIDEPSNLLALFIVGIAVKNKKIVKKLHNTLIIAGIKL
jgi:hypothetical protein